MKVLLIIFILSGLCTFGQKNSDSKNTSKKSECYEEHFSINNESVFTKIESLGYFKGGADAFLNFLISHINFNTIVKELSENERQYSDTATVRFIISRKEKISDLTIAETKKKSFKEELFKAIKSSSCNWVPGESSDRLLNGWFQLKIYYSIDRQQRQLSVRIGFDKD